MQQLCNLGNQVPNILKQPDETIGDTFYLSEEWSQMAITTLHLPSAEHLYMIWLWLDSLYDHSLLRIDESGSVGLDLASHRGAESIERTMTTMRMEVPLIALAVEFYS